MPTDDPRSDPARDQTDESLRAERAQADILGQSTAEIEEAADALIEKARERADRVLAEARQRSDQSLPAGALGGEPRKILEHERRKEDEALRKERGTADATLKLERAEHAALMEADRGATDRYLSVERARADVAVSTRDELLGIVSHDLRNMLGAMLGFGSMIAAAEVTDDHEARVLGLTERIRRSGFRMNRLIGDLVDLASIEAGCLSVTREIGDPIPIVEEAVDTFRAQATALGLSLVAEYPAQRVVAAFDAARILQTLVNLITNAIKFTSRGGTVTVRVRATGDDLTFAVMDTGAGIPEDQLDLVFERYRQAVPNDRRGVGLGLYISKCIVSGHGGRIWVESRLGEGSTFYFTIPAAT
jgi:signal transduction histidine kinase